MLMVAALTSSCAGIYGQMQRAGFFVHAQELLRYRREEWYVRLALGAWSKTKSPRLDEFAGELLGGAGLLPLRVAVADPERERGLWAVWTGIVRDARLDHAT